MDEKQDRKPGPGDSPGTLLAAKMTQLAKLKEKLTKAKDESVQSWLDSKPVIDELEKLQSELEDAKRRTALSNADTIPELETQLETLNASIRARKEDELKVRTTINEINQVLQRTQAEMEQMKIERDEKHRARFKLKQVLRLRRQTIRTLQLTLRAVRLESEAYGTSAAEANRYITHSQMDEAVVKLTQEEYRALTKKAREETSLAEWRISVSVEQKQVVKESKDSAAKRFKDMNSVTGSRRREHEPGENEDQIATREHEARENEDQIATREHEERENEDQTATKAELQPNIRARLPAGATDTRREPPKNMASSNSKFSQRKPKEQSRISKGKNKNLSKKQKSACFARIRILLVQKIKKLF